MFESSTKNIESLTLSDMARDKLFHSLDQAALKVRSSTVTSRVLGTSSWKELADHSRHLPGISVT